MPARLWSAKSIEPSRVGSIIARVSATESRPLWAGTIQETRAGFTRANHLSSEQLESILEHVREGMPMTFACREVGTSSTQFLRRCRREPELEARRMKAIEEGREPYQELIRSTAFDEAFVQRNYKAIRDQMLMHLPEASILGMQKHLISAMDPDDFRMMAARQLGDMSDEDLKTFIEIMERQKTGALPVGETEVSDG